MRQKKVTSTEEEWKGRGEGRKGQKNKTETRVLSSAVTEQDDL